MTNLTNKLFLPVFMLLLSISPAAAHNDTFFNSPHRLELKPASFAEGGYRLAKSYWLGGADLDLNFKDEDDKTRCNSMGYFQEACQGNKSPLLKCPYNSAYFKCTCDTSIYRYSALNCPPGSYPDEDVCDDYSKGCVCEGAFVWNSYDNSCDFYCSSDYDCPGQVCRTSSGDCVDCVYDSDCGSGQACTDNKCETVDLCENVSCTGGQTCNASTGACECPSGQVLSDGRCEQANCANGGPSCSTGVCDMDSGQCVECTSDSHCGGNKECINNTCQVIDACKNVTCTGGKSCVDGTCVCPSGQLDNNGTCEAPNCTNGGISCSGSTPQCSSSGQCVECTSDSHCANGEKCISNFCQTVDACEGITCVGGKICVNGNCLCPSGQLDNNGTCELPNCANGGITCTGGKECQNKVCVCPSNKPNLSNGVCVECASNSQCSGGKECSGNVCKCPSSKPYLNGGTCAECSINSHCSNGKTCQSGICACPSGQSIFNGICEIPNCVNGGVTCPSGQTCNTTTKLCEASFRACQIGDIFYSDVTCSDQYLADKTPVGVVVDAENRLLIDLTEAENILAAPGMPGSVDGGYPQFTNVGNELPINGSERGFENTLVITQTTKNTSPVGICFQKTNSALENSRWYVPASREVFRLIKLINSSTFDKVNATLQMLSQHISSVKTIGNRIWTSDEVRGSNETMLVYDPQSASSGLTPMAKSATGVYFRCMARYKCPQGTKDCTIKPQYTAPNPMQGYVAGNASCVPPYFKETFIWNNNFTRCVWDESSSGGTTDPTKTPCQVNDSMYCSGSNCFCTTASSELYYNGATYMGRIGKLGLVIIGQIGSASSVSDAESQCSGYTRQSFSNWRIIYTSDADNWGNIIYNLGRPFAKNGSYGYYWDGYGWNSQLSNNRSGTLYCTHSYSNIYRE